MNVKEAKEIIKSELNGKKQCNSVISQANGFLDCYYAYKPLVEALEKIANNTCRFWMFQEISQQAQKALDHYRKNILGEEK
jgi:hypothetical protein